MPPSLHTRRAVLSAPEVLLASRTTPASVMPEAIAHDLILEPPGRAAIGPVTLKAAMAALPVVSADIVVLDAGRIIWVCHAGPNPPNPVYQAASLSKLVAAVGALRLVQRRRLDLDGDLHGFLSTLGVVATPGVSNKGVTLRRLLGMTAGINVPGYAGYAPGAAIPTLMQIISGTPPANSPPVRIVYTPGSRYVYSGGGFEIVQALIEQATGRPFADAMRTLVLDPVGMTASTFVQPPPAALVARIAPGHFADGTELPGKWMVIPELAAGGLWSNARDLGALLAALLQSWRGVSGALLSAEMMRAMTMRVDGGPYGAGSAVAGAGRDLVLMKRGQNVGYQSYLLVYPATGQGIVVMTGSDNGTTLATAVIRRAAKILRWPPLGELMD